VPYEPRYCDAKSKFR